MKNYLNILLLAVTFFSCNDAIEITQDGELNNQTLFNSLDNMQLVLNEVYDQMNTVNELLLSSILTDEVSLGDAGFPSDTHSYQIFSTDGFAERIWRQKYTAINRANRLLEGATFVTPDNTQLAEYNNIIAQARAIRAWCHFQLMVYYSTDISNDAALGVMLLDFVPTIEQSVPRATNGEIFAAIEADLSFAQNNLNNDNVGAGSWTYINDNFINAMRARMYLYRKNYTLAEQYADNIIDNPNLQLASCSFTLPSNFPLTSSETSQIAASGSNSFDTAPPAGTIQFALFEMDRWTANTTSPLYRKMWVDNAQGEAIFSLTRPNNNSNFSSTYNTNNSDIAGAPLWDMGRNLYNLFTEPLGGGAEDFRRWCFVDRSATILDDASNATRGNEVIVIDKYPGKDGSHNSNDIKVFRVSEMYFIKAECRVEANDLDAAEALIQEVRQNRNYIDGAVVPTPDYANPTEAYADILLERRKELCFEGHRYIDLKRIGMRAGVTETDRFSTDSENSSAVNPFNISVTDYRFTLPIPQDEINVNALEQNPGDTY